MRAVDLAENPDADARARYTWLIEAAPRDDAAQRSPAGRDRQHDGDVHVLADRADATFECSLDAARVRRRARRGVTYTDVPYGEHEFEVRAKGPAGSVDPTPASTPGRAAT